MTKEIVILKSQIEHLEKQVDFLSFQLEQQQTNTDILEEIELEKKKTSQSNSKRIEPL